MWSDFIQYNRRFFGPLLSYKLGVGIIVVRALYFAFSGVAFSYVVKITIDAVAHGNSRFFSSALILLTLLFFFDIVPNHFMRRMHKKFFLFFENLFYNMYLYQYFHLDNNIVDHKGTGYYINVLQRGISNWTNLLHSFCERGVQVVAKILFAIILITIYTGLAGLVFSLSLVVFSIIIALYGNMKARMLRRERRELHTAIDRSLVRMIMSKFEILSQGKISIELEHFGLFFKKLYKILSQESYLRIFAFDIQQGLIKGLQLVLIMYVGYGVLHGTQEIGVIALVWMLCNQINSAIDAGNNFIGDYYDRIIYVQKLWQVFDQKFLMKGYSLGNDFVYLGGDIVFEEVTYAYDKNKIFEKFSLVIKGGKKTAFVGLSGAGKSTLLKLIAGYIQPQEGRIRVGNQYLPTLASHEKDKISLLSYYQSIGYLSQEPNVFDGTIYDNLIYALPEPPHLEEIQKVLADAQCEFVLEFPDGIHTQIGEKGIRLSGGQRQRLAIAKIMLKDPPIIILDEPTSALDSFSEESVTKAFDALTIGRTVIVVAHRLQTVKHADHIVVLENGKCVESGTHTTLLKNNGVYARMLELQSGF